MAHVQRGVESGPTFDIVIGNADQSLAAGEDVAEKLEIARLGQVDEERASHPAVRAQGPGIHQEPDVLGVLRRDGDAERGVARLVDAARIRPFGEEPAHGPGVALGAGPVKGEQVPAYGARLPAPERSSVFTVFRI